MTTQEIKIAGFRLFRSTVTAKMNVFNGCIEDKKIVEENTPRLIKMVDWFKSNGLMEDFKYYVFKSNGLNSVPISFHASELFTEITK